MTAMQTVILHLQKDSWHVSEVVLQNIHKVSNSESLFYTTVIVGRKLYIGGMLDSGSIACTINEMAKMKSDSWLM